MFNTESNYYFESSGRTCMSIYYIGISVCPGCGGGDLFSCVRASNCIESIHNVACSVRSNPEAVNSLLFSVSCQSAAVSGVFASYPHSSGHGLAEP